MTRLNPCFNGKRRIMVDVRIENPGDPEVLILVLMEEDGSMYKLTSIERDL